MSNKKHYHNPEEGALVMNTHNYFRYHENKIKIGFSFSYGIRNHSNKSIHVRGRGGYSQVIHPWEEPTLSMIDQELEERDVWIDIKFRIGSLKDSNYSAREHNNGIDDTIAKEIDKRVYAAFKTSLTKDEPFECEFTISLRNIIPNFKSNGFHSETLGIIIEFGHKARVVDWLGEAIEHFEDEQQFDSKTDLLDIRSCTYQFIHLVDNRGEIGNLWISQSGTPKLIRALKNSSLDSGLYIFSNEHATREKPYTYIPTTDISDDTLRKYGIGRTETEILIGSRTKDYVDLKNEKEKVIKSLDEVNVLIKKKDEEIDKLKKDQMMNNLKHQREKFLFDCDRMESKFMLKIITMMNEHGKVIQKGVDEHKKLNSSNNPYSISGIGAIFKLIFEGLKLISLLPA